MRMEKLFGGRGRDGGFTLVEVMIVVVMVAILATSAMPLCSGYIIQAKMAEGIAGCGTIRTAMQIKRVKNDGKYPVLFGASGDALKALGFKPNDLDGTIFDAGSYTVSSTESTYIISVRYEGNGPNEVKTYSIDDQGEKIGDFTVQ